MRVIDNSYFAMPAVDVRFNFCPFLERNFGKTKNVSLKQKEVYSTGNRSMVELALG